MHSAVFLAIGFLLSAAPSPETLKQYADAASTVGRSPEANLKLALWCEAHGLEPERERHLAMVIVADPDNAVARGLLGEVRDDGKWRGTTAVAERIQSDPAKVATLEAYAARRAKTRDTAASQWKLALWCDKHGLKREATAHFVAVLRHDPNDEPARKRLGYKKHGSHWATDEQIEREKSEAQARKKADIHWTHILEAGAREAGASEPT